MKRISSKILLEEVVEHFVKLIVVVQKILSVAVDYYQDSFFLNLK
jgi:hypothetical protein